MSPRSLVQRSIAFLVVVVVLSGARVARAEEKEKAPAQSEPQLIAPALVGGVGLGLLVTSAVFWGQWASARDDAESRVWRVPATKDHRPICEDPVSAQVDPQICADDREMRTSATAALVTGAIGVAAITTAIVWTVLEVRRANRAAEAAPTTAHFTPTVGPNGAGAAFDVRF
jgi:hypothetical protein